MKIKKVIQNFKMRCKEFFKPKSKLATKAGSYSIITTIIVLGIIIVLNIFVQVLPSNYTKFDISSSKLYSITSNTKAVVNNLKEDVTIYWIVQNDQEDDIIENLLSKYDGLSKHINVVKKNPDAFPTFTEKYTDEEVPNNSLIVECDDKSRYISYNDIYVQSADMYSYSYTTSFDGEGAITSAIDYVVSDELPQMYVLEGHGESTFPSTFSNSLEKENIEVSSLSLLNVDEIPEDADVLVIYNPASDISEEEATMLKEYVAEGGKLLVMAGPVEDKELTNLNSILKEYNISIVDGLVIEKNRNNYAYGYPYILMPNMNSSDITNSLIEANYKPIFPISQGLKIKTTSNANVTELLTTSSEAFSKRDGFNINTYDKENGDTDGPFALGVLIENENEGQIVWYSASDFLNDKYNAYSSGANVDLVMNSLSALIGERENLSIRSKSLNYSYLTIDENTASKIKVMMIGVCPLSCMGIGIYVILKRRKKQNETN